MKFKSLQDKISSITSKMPNKIAIEHGDKSISFIELEEKANQVANFFYDRIDDQNNITLLMDRSINLVQGILGIIKCGGVFVPLDPLFPENRIRLMLDKVHSNWIITESSWLNKLDNIMSSTNRKINVLVLDNHNITFSKFKNIEVFLLEKDKVENNYFSPNVFNKNCYIYFTSGSTGEPKAILGRHRSGLSLASKAQRMFGFLEFS